LISAGAPPQTPLGELTALPRPLAGLKEPTSKGRQGMGGEWKRRKRMEREDEEGGERVGRGLAPSS